MGDIIPDEIVRKNCLLCFSLAYYFGKYRNGWRHKNAVWNTEKSRELFGETAKIIVGQIKSILGRLSAESQHLAYRNLGKVKSLERQLCYSYRAVLFSFSGMSVPMAILKFPLSKCQVRRWLFTGERSKDRGARNLGKPKPRLDIA